MKLMDAIAEFDARQYNTVDPEQKIKWLERVDQRVFQQIIKTHEGADKEKAIEEYIQANVTAHEEAVVEYMKVNEVSREEAEQNVVFQEIKYKEAKEYIEATRNDIFFKGYTNGVDAELLIPEPYSTAYIWWLEAQVHLLNKEYDDYNNAVLLYNKEFEDYARWYTRTHMPLAENNDFRWGG